MQCIITRFLFFIMLAGAPIVYAKPFIEWHSTNIQLSKGWGYKLGDSGKSIITFEHANAWRYGDFYMFMDEKFNDHDGKTNFYGEYTPRVSLGKMLGKDISYGFFKDILLAGTYEKGKSNVRRHLYGVAVDLHMPGFKYFKCTAYVRDNPHLRGTTWQGTLVWNKPFHIVNTKWSFEGYADFAGREGPTYHANQHTAPKILLDVGDLFNSASGKFYAGVEWEYWHHQFGIKHVSSSVPQLQVKWVF